MARTCVWQKYFLIRRRTSTMECHINCTVKYLARMVSSLTIPPNIICSQYMYRDRGRGICIILLTPDDNKNLVHLFFYLGMPCIATIAWCHLRHRIFNKLQTFIFFYPWRGNLEKVVWLINLKSRTELIPKYKGLRLCFFKRCALLILFLIFYFCYDTWRDLSE